MKITTEIINFVNMKRILTKKLKISFSKYKDFLGNEIKIDLFKKEK